MSASGAFMAAVDPWRLTTCYAKPRLAARRARELAAWRDAGIPASRSVRIHILTAPALVIPGPRVAAAARAIADVVFLQAR